MRSKVYKLNFDAFFRETCACCVSVLGGLKENRTVERDKCGFELELDIFHAGNRRICEADKNYLVKR